MKITLAELAKHNTENDCWIAIDGKVYDVTNFLRSHPGGVKILLKAGGTDASAQFHKFHNAAQVLGVYGSKLYKGELTKNDQAAVGASSTEKSNVKNASSVSAARTEFQHVENPALRLFGSQVPFGDPAWYQGHNAPKEYYNDSHRAYRRAVREFIDKEVTPFCNEWDEKKVTPLSVLQKAGKIGLLQGFVDTKWPSVELAGSTLPGGIKPSEFDAFHFIILLDELCRCGSVGAIWGISEHIQIAVPPLLHWGTPKMHKEVVGPCLRGEKRAALCITEPAAGSDVANLLTEAKKTPCGKYYIVNGEKKWITNGMFADYFTVAVRTGGPGAAGISMLLIERGPGVTTKQMQCMGVWASGTAYVTFEDVKVPVENLISKENEGFKCIMHNFNFERLGFCVQANRLARVCYEESYKYAQKRVTFGKKLIDHQVIRWKLAEMARQIEASWAQIESITYQIKTMSHSESNELMGAHIALSKVQNTKLFEYCAREAAQIFGGLSYSRGGQGEKVERLYREVRSMAIPGGSEEILLDFGVKQQKRIADKLVKQNKL